MLLCCFLFYLISSLLLFSIMAHISLNITDQPSFDMILFDFLLFCSFVIIINLNFMLFLILFYSISSLLLITLQTYLTVQF